MKRRRRNTRLMRLGVVPYEEALALQRRIAAGRREGKEPDTLLLLEHEPVITLGRNATGDNVLFSKEALVARGVSLSFVDRGGDATFHGPGQLVAYPILDLRPRRCRVAKYVSDLEEIMIRCCRDLGLAAARKARRAVELLEVVVAAELMAAAQGLEFHRPLRPARVLERVRRRLRERVAPLDEDRPPAPDLASVAEGVRAGDYLP